MFGKRKVGSRRAAEPLEKIIESCALRKNRFAESKCKDSASAVPHWFLVISGGFAGKWRKKSFLHGLASRKSFMRKHINTSISNFIVLIFYLLFCFFIIVKKRMFFRQARGSACKAVVAFYYYSSVRCLISKASINFFKISNPPKNARFSLFSLIFTQTACYFNQRRIKVLVEALTKILERLATIEVRMILFSISNYSRSLMVMSMSSTPSAKMFEKISPGGGMCV